ncbi:MAG TPA: ABC transporter permease [Streptosporangiaceae bacterium]|nr:ABC transporter permease [Streptosporangiaceae bacterium]
MTGYLIRRTGQALVVVIGVMIMTFVMIHLEPGSAARAYLGPKATPSRIAVFNATYGLNQPVTEQFVSYFWHLIHGDFGISYFYQQPVSTLIVERLPSDFFLVGISSVLAVLIALPTGIYQAVRRTRLSDNLLTTTAFVLYAMPDFFFGFLLIAVFAIQLHWLPAGFNQAEGSSFTIGGILAQPAALVLPITLLTFTSISGWSQFMRSSAIETLAQDYVRMAKAKGLPDRLVLARHVARNSSLSIITLLGLSLPNLVVGAVITEYIFNYPGLGVLFLGAALDHDFPIMMASELIVGVTTVVGNLAADVAYGMLDPRIRHAG